ncbi:pre-mrna-splicing factor slu7 [Gossypium australe]|uniref:Pre-mrna-splicing factor slu7 n=1 Tax=Gossypium australe TaxID=47621 RepID=A0A5B6X551_9ROSI|nr:pre-mrna-splicing factor slu7 [Gossypium australe]
MLRILERVAGTTTGTRGQRSVTKRFQSNGAEILRRPRRELWTTWTAPRAKIKSISVVAHCKGGHSARKTDLGILQICLLEKIRGCQLCGCLEEKGDRSVAEYEAEFLRLSLYARAAFVDKAKIAKEVKCTERQNCEKDKGMSKRDSEPSSFVQRPKKKARIDGPIRVGTPIAATGQPPCTDCGRRHLGECWKRIGACLRCGSLEHRITDYLWRVD